MEILTKQLDASKQQLEQMQQERDALKSEAALRAQLEVQITELKNKIDSLNKEKIQQVVMVRDEFKR